MQQRHASAESDDEHRRGHRATDDRRGGGGPGRGVSGPLDARQLPEPRRVAGAQRRLDRRRSRQRVPRVDEQHQLRARHADVRRAGDAGAGRRRLERVPRLHAARRLDAGRRIAAGRAAGEWLRLPCGGDRRDVHARLRLRREQRLPAVRRDPRGRARTACRSTTASSTCRPTVAATCTSAPAATANSPSTSATPAAAAASGPPSLSRWANLLLSSDAQPTGADFRGSLLDTTAHGTANLAFTAGDPGPGVYQRRRHDRDQRGLQRRRPTRTPASACRSAPTARAAR